MHRILARLCLVAILSALILSACQVPPRMRSLALPRASASSPGPDGIAPPTPKPAAVPPAAPIRPLPTSISGEFPSAGGAPELTLAVSTSLDASGLLGVLLPAYEQASGAKVTVKAVSSGAALELGRRGEVGVLWLDTPTLEVAFMGEGHGTRREAVMTSDYVIVGDAEDRAGIKGQREASLAYKQLAKVGAVYVSPGDGSGARLKERELMAKAGVEPGPWYIATGEDAATTLSIANEGRAYTLTERATYMARTLDGLDLEVLVQGGASLRNPYSAIVVDPAKDEDLDLERANAFVDWLISLPTQAMIGGYGVERFDRPVYLPDSRLWSGRAGE